MEVDFLKNEPNKILYKTNACAKAYVNSQKSLIVHKITLNLKNDFMTIVIK